jgi:hypothetical protein
MGLPSNDSYSPEVISVSHYTSITIFLIYQGNNSFYLFSWAGLGQGSFLKTQVTGKLLCIYLTTK